MKLITILNLDKYQHYKDRHIIWIKLYVDILQDHKFCQLNDRERYIFIALILLAVKNNNEIPADWHYIARQILFSPRGLSEIVTKLCNLKLIAIKRIAKRKRNAILDKIREDKRREEEISSSKKLKPFYKGDEMRKSQGKFWVLPKDGGKWLEFCGEEKDIQWK